jgi:hypothetical protein
VQERKVRLELVDSSQDDCTDPRILHLTSKSTDMSAKDIKRKGSTSDMGVEPGFSEEERGEASSLDGKGVKTDAVFGQMDGAGPDYRSVSVRRTRKRLAGWKLTKRRDGSCLA